MRIPAPKTCAPAGRWKAAVPKRLAPRCPGRPGPQGSLGRGWERPGSPRACYGFGAVRVCAPRPRPLGSLPNQQSVPEVVSSAASRRRRTRWPAGWPVAPAKAATRPEPARRLAFPYGILMDRSDPRRGWDGSAHPDRRRAVPDTRRAGSLPPRPHSPDGTAVRAGVVQPQRGQRHAAPLPRTWRRRFRAHAPRCRCARAVRHRPRPIGGQDPSPRNRLERHTDSRGSFLRTGPNQSRALISPRR